jgi:hypothetical protein
VNTFRLSRARFATLETSQPLEGDNLWVLSTVNGFSNFSNDVEKKRCGGRLRGKLVAAQVLSTVGNWQVFSIFQLTNSQEAILLSSPLQSSPLGAFGVMGVQFPRSHYQRRSQGYYPPVAWNMAGKSHHLQVILPAINFHLYDLYGMCQNQRGTGPRSFATHPLSADVTGGANLWRSDPIRRPEGPKKRKCWGMFRFKHSILGGTPLWILTKQNFLGYPNLTFYNPISWKYRILSPLETSRTSQKLLKNIKNCCMISDSSYLHVFLVQTHKMWSQMISPLAWKIWNQLDALRFQVLAPV